LGPLHNNKTQTEGHHEVVAKAVNKAIDTYYKPGFKC
jgi:hypothetical protein